MKVPKRNTISTTPGAVGAARDGKQEQHSGLLRMFLREVDRRRRGDPIGGNGGGQRLPAIGI